SRDLPMLAAWAQSTPLVPVRAFINWFAIPTPMMEPISVCELEAGRPKYQVPRFHRIAATNSANTIANPAPLPTCRINSTGSSEPMPNATAPVDVTTPAKFQNPDHTTATCGSRECVYITVATAFAVSWNPFTNSNPKATSSAKPSNTYGQVDPNR